MEHNVIENTLHGLNKINKMLQNGYKLRDDERNNLKYLAYECEILLAETLRFDVEIDETDISIAEAVMNLNRE